MIRRELSLYDFATLDAALTQFANDRANDPCERGRAESLRDLFASAHEAFVEIEEDE